MARLLFEEQGIRTRRGSLASGVAYVVYTDAAGTFLADISATADATAASTATVVAATSTVTLADIAGLGPAALKFYGPDDVDTLYLRCPSDTSLGVQEIEADTDERLDALDGGGGGGGVHPDLAAHDALGLATDAELTAHAAAADPHAGYALELDHTLASHDTLGLATDAELATHEAAADPHAGYVQESAHTLAAHDTLGLATDAELGAHAVAADPHPGYALESDHTLAAHDTLGLATDTELSAHAGAANPHPGYATDADLAAHDADTTAIHGIADTSVLATDADLATHAGATDPHGDRAYADAIAQGLDPKASVRVKTTANITLSGEQTIDGVLTSASRVLVANQSTAAENGIYVSAAGAWARSTDADTSGEVTTGLYCFVEEGTAQASSGWVLTTPAPITLGTTALAFSQFSQAGQILGGAGLVKTGNTLDVVAGTGLAVAADTVGISPGGVSVTELAASAVTNAKVDPAAAIAESKLALTFPTHAEDHAARHAVAGADPLPGYATGADLSAHEAAADPHAGYALESDHTLAAHDTLGLATDAELATHEAAADPHTGYALESAHTLAAHDALGLATDAELATHEAALDPHGGYVLESAHTSAAHDTIGLVTDAILATHEADTTVVHGIADTAQVALRNAANTFTADNLFRSGRPFVDVRAYGTDTAAIDAAAAAAFAAGAVLYFSKGGDYTYSGTGLTPSGSFTVVGAGRGLTTITLGAGVYLLNPSAGLTACHVADFTTSGGAGLFRSTRTSANVAGRYLFERLTLNSYTVCGISNNSSDMPYWDIRNCVFFPASDTGTIGVALSDAADGSHIQDNSFLQNQIDIKLRRGGVTVHISGNDFIHWNPTPAQMRARIWAVPHTSATNAGLGLVVRDNKFGSENGAAGDLEILYADEDAIGTDNGTKLPVTSADSTGFVRGHTIIDNKFSGPNSRPLIYSTTPNVRELRVTGILDGTPPAYLLQFRTPPTNDRTIPTSVFGPFTSANAGIEYAGVPVTNALGSVGAVIDPLVQFDAAIGKGFAARPGGLSPVGYVKLLSTGIRSFSNPNALTLANVADALGGADATEVTFGSGTVYQNNLANPTVGKPCWLEFDLKAGSSTPLDQLTVLLRYTSNGAIHFKRIVAAPSSGWAPYRFPVIFSTQTTTILVIFSTESGHTGKIQIGRVRVYHAHEPVNDTVLLPSVSAPAAPAAGAFVYVDSADSKVKAIKASGDIIVFG